jgi:antitoxin YefM
MSITASEARARLFPLIEQVNDDQMAVEIVSKKGNAFLVSADEWHALQETLYLLQSPANAERLRASIETVGQASEHSLIEPDHEVDELASSARGRRARPGGSIMGKE